MIYKNPEVRLLVRIMAIVGFIILFVALGSYLFIRLKAPHLLEFSQDIEEFRIEIEMDSLQEARFITGMSGCENIAPVEGSHALYVSCMDGSIHYLNGTGVQDLAVLKSAKPGKQAMGLTFGKNDMLYAAIVKGTPDEWKTRGGGIFRFSRNLEFYERLTNDYPSINGIASDTAGHIYFTSSNFSILNPSGTIYRLSSRDGHSFAEPEKFLSDTGLANGLYFDRFQNKIFYSNTMGGVFEFEPGMPALKEVYLKTKFLEACDDLCTDIGGNVWMTDPGQSTVKMYNPGTGRLARFVIGGIGQTSSCRIRTENGEEMLYITELKKIQKPMSREFDGRGILVVPTRSLILLVEPLLITSP